MKRDGPHQHRKGGNTPRGGKKWALDLFSGTGSVREVLEKHGYTVVSVDNDPRWHADVREDILTWDYATAYPAEKFPFDIIAASPPCVEYSRAMTSPRPRRLEEADRLVAKALEIIRHYSPRLWWVENPRGGLLKTRDVVAGLQWLDADYCQFSSTGFQKPTRFWS